MGGERVQQILKVVRGLPPLPAAVQRLCEMADDPDARLREMADIILADQNLTARILRVANSAFYGLSGRIATVNQAIVLLGFHAIRNMALSLSLIQVRVKAGSRAAIDPMDLWRHSLATACAARRVAVGLGMRDPEEAFVAGLLHDIGKIVLSEFLPEEYESLLARVASGEGSLTALERDLFQLDHARVGRELCGHWKLPRTLSEVVAGHHGRLLEDGDELRAAELLRAVRLGNALSRIAGIGSGGDPFIGDEFWKLVGEERSRRVDLDRILSTLVEETRTVESAFGLASSQADGDPAWPDGPPAVGLQLREPRQRELVRMTLLALGTRPVLVDPRKRAAEILAALIVERASPDREDTMTMMSNPKVLDLGAWNDGRSSPAASSFHVDDLRSWLAKGLRSAEGVPTC